MSFVNYASREIFLKIVYYGPGLCGKTANVQYIYERTAPEAKGKMISLATESERTLFFDFLPLDIGKIAGFRVRLQLYTVPGQIFYRAARRLVMKGLDGLVFVADSQPGRLDANLEILEELPETLAEHGLTFSDISLVMQYNKRDLPDILDIAELRAALNPNGAPEIEAAANSGRGVFDTLKLISTLVLRRIEARMKRPA